MVASRPPLTTDLTAVPLPRRPLEQDAAGDDPVRRWYENELGWPTVPASTPESPVRLRLGLRFDVLDVPAEAGGAALRHLAGASPVAVRGDRMLLLVAAGSTEELPGLLDWLEWGALALDLRAIGTGGVMRAPRPPEPGAGHIAEVPSGQSARSGPGADASRDPASLPEPGVPVPRPPGNVPAEVKDAGRTAGSRRPLSPGRPGALQGAAVWLRPPEPGCEVEASLPTMSALGGVGGAPDLVRVVNTVATQCHRLRLWRTRP
ncbi:SCO3374 family protein [Streptomyces pseudovenezuelae]|uniref:SCO3374 family protein n=1 Tax=Streptomyces pseudovenezuelae TaxID=67350 RepID=UPI002E35C632|nr:SCO3374 family protein [Streptomyces pseudovenezuelae]